MKKGYIKNCQKLWNRFTFNLSRSSCLILLFLFTQSAKFIICLIVYTCYFAIVLMMKILRFVLYQYLQQKNVDAHTETFLKKMQEAIQKSDIALFFYEFLRSPSSIGSVYPSSKKLAQCIAQQVVLRDDRVVVELGAGTGIVTAALLRRGINPKQLVIIEKSPQLIQRLKKHFPNVLVIEGDAIDLIKILASLHKLNVGTVVSSLPLRSLPTKMVQTITDQIHQLLDDNAQYIQFTYDLRKKKADTNMDFYCIYSKTVWLNFPPALVYVFTSHNLRKLK